MPDPAHAPLFTTAATPQDIAPALEAILLSVDRPLTAAAIAPALFLARHQQADEDQDDKRQIPKGAETLIHNAVTHLNTAYAATGRSFRIEPVAGGYRVMTLPDHAAAVAAFHRSRQSARLSRAAVETLAIIAYKQPITRATLEAIRGVACGEVLRTLVDRKLVTIKGHAEELGRPLLYGTTRQFLDAFGLPSISDLPSVTELKPFAETKPAGDATAPPPAAPDSPPAPSATSAQPA